jgi:hypothetical protein
MQEAWKEAMAANYTSLYKHLLGRMEKTRKCLGINDVPAQTRTWDLPDMKQE